MRYAWRCWYCGYVAWLPGFECCGEQVARNRNLPERNRELSRNPLVHGEHVSADVERYYAQSFVPISRRFKHFRCPPEPQWTLGDDDLNDDVPEYDPYGENDDYDDEDDFDE